MAYRTYGALVASVSVAVLMLAANQTFARSAAVQAAAPRGGFTSKHLIYRPSAALRHNRGNYLGTFWPTEDGYGPNGEPAPGGNPAEFAPEAPDRAGGHFGAAEQGRGSAQVLHLAKLQPFLRCHVGFKPNVARLRPHNGRKRQRVRARMPSQTAGRKVPPRPLKLKAGGLAPKTERGQTRGDGFAGLANCRWSGWVMHGSCH